MSPLTEIARIENAQHHAGTIRSRDPLTVESIPDRWSYTISVPLILTDGGPEASLPLLVAADVTVHEGELGLLLVGGDLATLLGRLPPTVGAGRHTVELVLENESPATFVVFRNHTPGNRSCVFTLESIAVRPAPPDALTVRSRIAEVSTPDLTRIDVARLGASVTRSERTTHDDGAVFELLRKKWSTVPAGLAGRRSSKDLVSLADDELERLWSGVHAEATTGEGFAVRGWYQTLYRDVLRGRSVLEIGSGMGIDGIEFARSGACLTFVDIVESNLEVLERLCRIFGVRDARYVYLENLTSLDALPSDFDVVFAQGSLINAPFDFAQNECAAILRHLKPGGRWIELAYPKERWVRDGQPRFSVWGTMTDGEGTPWMEWYDLPRLLKRLAPVQFAPVLALNFHNDDFNWFDLVRLD